MTSRFILLTALLAAPAAMGAPVTTRGFIFFPQPGTEGVAQQLAETADQDRASVSLDLGHDYDGVTAVHVVSDREAFRAAIPSDAAQVPGWAAAVAFPEHNLVVMRLDPSGQEPRAILRHELSHIAVGRLVRGRIPRWFLEGLAVIRAGDAWSREGPSLIRAGMANDLLPIESLQAGFPERPTDAELAYEESAAFVKFLMDRRGEVALQDVMRQVVKGSTFDDAVLRVYGASTRQLENQWRKSVERWVLALDFATSREFLWMLLTLLMIWAGLLLRRRRAVRLAQLEREDEAEAARALIQAPALWADGPRPSDTSAAATTALTHAERTVMVEGQQEDEAGGQPKKPTLH